MNVNSAVTMVLTLALACAFPLPATAKKKKANPRGMLESMQAVPCGAKQRGVAGVGSLWASIGITHVNSNEKLCPQYLVRTDDMDYEIRPKDTNHPAVLPVGQEVEIKLKKDHMELKVPDNGKAQTFLVVSMKPTAAADPASQDASARPADRP